MKPRGWRECHPAAWGFRPVGAVLVVLLGLVTLSGLLNEAGAQAKASTPPPGSTIYGPTGKPVGRYESGALQGHGRVVEPATGKTLYRVEPNLGTGRGYYLVDPQTGKRLGEVR